MVILGYWTEDTAASRDACREGYFAIFPEPSGVSTWVNSL